MPYCAPLPQRGSIIPDKEYYIQTNCTVSHHHESTVSLHRVARRRNKMLKNLCVVGTMSVNSGLTRMGNSTRMMRTTMEWEYTSNPPRWRLTVGLWRATVERLARPRSHWAPRVEQIEEPHTRYDGPLSDDVMQAHSWCLAKIAELRTQTGRSQ